MAEIRIIRINNLGFEMFRVIYFDEAAECYRFKDYWSEDGARRFSEFQLLYKPNQQGAGREDVKR